MDKSRLEGHNTKQQQLVIGTTQNFSEVLNTSERIKGILDNNDQEQITNSQNRLNELLGELEIEVKRISDEFGYEYEHYSYRKRLNLEDGFINNRVQKLLKENIELNNIYNKLLLLYDNDILLNAQKELLYSEYLEDLAYESIDLMEEIALPEKQFGNFKTNFNQIELKERLCNCDSFINELQKVSTLFLDESSLWSFDMNILKKLFGTLGHIKYMNLGKNDFGLPDFDNINDLFKGLNLKMLDIRDVSLHNLSSDSLDCLFSKFNNLRGINLSENNFSLLNKSQLRTIFTNLRSLKYIDLGLMDLSKLDIESLEIIFTNLTGIVNIELKQCDLGSMNNEQLRIIFSNIINTKHIELENNSLSDVQKSYIASLFPNNRTHIYFGNQN